MLRSTGRYCGSGSATLGRFEMRAKVRQFLGLQVREKHRAVARRLPRRSSPLALGVSFCAPNDPQDVASVAWQNSSLCWRCIREGEARPKTARQSNDFGLAVKYWLKEFPALAPKTRSIIVTNLTSMLDIFLRGTLRELFCTS